MPASSDVLAAGRAPAVLALLERRERAVREERAAAGDERVAQRLRDRVAGAVADLEQALRRRAAAAGEPVAAVLPRELDAELLEPVDRALRVAGEDLDEPHVGAVVRALEDVGGVLLGRVVVAEGGLDPALRLRRVAGLDRALGRDRHARARAFGGDGGGEPGGAAADHEHVEGVALRHVARIPNPLMHCISHRYHQKIERSSSSTSAGVTGRGLALAPGREATDSATALGAASGTPRSRSRRNPPSAASSSTFAGASSVPRAAAKRAICSPAAAALKRSAGGSVSALRAPCATP